MSVINKYPFINTLLGSLTSEQLKDLNDCINGQYEGSVITRTLKSWGNSLLTESDKGIYPIQLELNGPAATTLPGYLIYTDDYCVLISYANDDACKLTIVNITMPESGSDIKWEYVSESLTVNELRSSLFDAAAGEGGGSGGGGSGGTVVDLRDLNISFSGQTDITGQSDELDAFFRKCFVYDPQDGVAKPMPKITLSDNFSSNLTILVRDGGNGEMAFLLDFRAAVDFSQIDNGIIFYLQYKKQTLECSISASYYVEKGEISSGIHITIQEHEAE